jgi:hypothetical protein
LLASAHWAHDIEHGEMLADAVRATQPDSDLSSPLVLMAHYAAIFGMAHEIYVESGKSPSV